MFQAIFLITIGLIFLGNNFAIIPWSVWSNLIPYWPMLLVFAGIDAIFGHSGFGRLLSGVVNSIIFLMIIARVFGFSYYFLKLIPLPRRNMPMEDLFFTHKDGINQRFYYFDGGKDTL